MGTFATTTAIDTLIPGVDISTSTASSLASKCITWAENHVKAKLSQRYDVSAWNTSTAVPPQVTSITEMLASGYFFKKISRGGPSSIERGNESINDAKDELKALATKDCDLLDSTGSFVNERTDEVSAAVISSTTSYHRTFDEDSPINWTIDPDKVSDIESGRL